MTKIETKNIRDYNNLIGHLLSKIRFSAFTTELARDFVKNFSLSTYLKTQKNCHG